MTPRERVRRAQARVILQELERRRRRITAGTIEAAAVARHAGQLPYSLIWEIVVAALELRRLPVPEKRTRAWPTTRDVYTFMRDALAAEPTLTSIDLCDRMEERGPLPISRSTFTVLVSRVRRELRILVRSGPPARRAAP